MNSNTNITKNVQICQVRSSTPEIRQITVICNHYIYLRLSFVFPQQQQRCLDNRMHKWAWFLITPYLGQQFCVHGNYVIFQAIQSLLRYEKVLGLLIDINQLNCYIEFDYDYISNMTDSLSKGYLFDSFINLNLCPTTVTTN